MIRVLHFTSHNEPCGIAKYQEQFLEGMSRSLQVHSDIFRLSPYTTRTMGNAEFCKVIHELRATLASYDILHVQHEFDFFSGDQLGQIAATAKTALKRLVVTVHSTRNVGEANLRLRGLSPRAFVHLAREARLRQQFERSHIQPLRAADVLIVHNQLAIERLLAAGVQRKAIRKFAHPVPVITHPVRSTEISRRLRTSGREIILGLVGFIGRQKGALEAIRALKFLPDNYKLAIIGGVHQLSQDYRLYDDIANTITELDLIDRVYITGYVKEDQRLIGLVGECDICVFPYDRITYGNASSSTLALAFANHKPAVAYPTPSFREVAEETEALVLCDTFSYYELAREIQRSDLKTLAEASAAYADRMAWPKIAKELEQLYLELMRE